MSGGTRSYCRGNGRINGAATVKSLADCVGIPGGIPANAIFALIQPMAQALWWTIDGSVPSATNGNQILATQTLEYDGELEKIRFLEAAATADIRVAFFG
jgi:hypothetical protein